MSDTPIPVVAPDPNQVPSSPPVVQPVPSVSVAPVVVDPVTPVEPASPSFPEPIASDVATTLPPASGPSTALTALADVDVVTPSVDDIVAQAIDIQQTFATNDQQSSAQAPTEPTADPSALPSVQPQPDESAADQQQPVADAVPASREPASLEESGDTKKSPLDILEEILGKQSGDVGAEEEKTAEEPAVPEKTPEEIAAEQARIAAEELARLEAKRQEMLQEVTSSEQQQRDAIRVNEMQSKQVDQLHDIYQIKRQRLPTTPTT